MDVEKIVVRSPYEFGARRGDAETVRFADEVVEVGVPKVSLRRAPLVASIDALDQAIRQIEFRLIDGKLFRPYLSHLHPQIVWTPEACRAVAPQMLFVRGSSAKGRWIPVLPNLFRGYDRNVSERTRKIARQTDPKECVEAVERAKTAANEGLRFVDGVLYQTTRAPAWSVDGEARLIPCMPDHDDFGQFALIDARYKQERILESFRKLRPLATRSMSLFEPSLLPNTSGVDSIGTFCQYILESARRDEVLFLTLHIEELMAMTEPAINGGPVPARAMTVLEELNRMGGVTRFPDEIRLTYQFLNVFPSPSDTPECDDPYADGPPILH